MELDLRKRLRVEHFQELAEIKKGQLFEEVPLWLWSPLVTERQCLGIARAATELGEKLLEIGRNERRLGREESWLPRREGLLESIRSDPWDADPTFHWRFDFLWDRTTGELKFLEVNAGDPSGLGWVESFTRAMRSHSFWEPLFQSGSLRSFELAAGHQAALESVLGPGPHAIAFAAAEASTVKSDIECWAEHYRRAGYSVGVTDPRRLSLEDDGVCLDGKRLRAVVRDTYEELYLGPYQGLGKKLQSRVTLLNPLCSSFWDSKTLWTALPSSVTVASTFLVRHIPSEERHCWVLKPAFDYGGRGVLCGFSCSAQEWETRFGVALKQPQEWVLQEAVRATPEEFPSLAPDGEIRWEKRFVTWSVFLNRLKFSGLFARAGQNPVVNVHNGGAIFPVYLQAE